MEVEPLAVAVLAHFLLFLQEVIVIHGGHSHVIRLTENGKIRGTRHHVHGKAVEVFYGIPFAQPPLGNLRFKAPIQIDPWDDVLDATNKPRTCMQGYDYMLGNFSGAQVWNPNTEPHEDCLYLNVWVPRVREPYANKAVMAWIYGGGFYSGSPSLQIYEAKYLAVENDVIVISLQYRVGALGFLTLGHPEAPGNVGLLDQRMALEWIQRNVNYFGGNPKNVTIFGESAGAVSVGLHLLSPTSRGLFNRAILQSGAPQTFWGTINMGEAERRSRVFAGYLGCKVDLPSAELIDCLRKVPMSSFPDAQWNPDIVEGIVQFPFLPVVDGNFLVETPIESLKAGRFKKTPLLIGSNENEGSYFLIYNNGFFHHNKESLISRAQFKLVMEDIFLYYPHYPHRLNNFGRDAIMHHYTYWLDPDNQTFIRDRIENSVADLHFICTVNELGLNYANAGYDVYYYWFSHRSTVSPWAKWMGVMHGDEINFIFGEPLNSSLEYTHEEKELSKKMMRFWTNFAKTG